MLQSHDILIISENCVVILFYKLLVLPTPTHNIHLSFSHIIITPFCAKHVIQLQEQMQSILNAKLFLLQENGVANDKSVSGKMNGNSDHKTIEVSVSLLMQWPDAQNQSDFKF